MHLPLPTLLHATLTLSAPLTLPHPSQIEATTSLTPNQTICKGYHNAFWNASQTVFKITIARPYLSGARCAEIQNKIAQHHFEHGNFTCEGADGDRYTVVTLTSNVEAGNLERVNGALGAAWLGVEFGCPTGLRR